MTFLLHTIASATSLALFLTMVLVWAVNFGA